jgi:pyruvate kinase
MVARGDLGVEMNPWDVPVLQKRIVETCKLLGKPVVSTNSTDSPPPSALLASQAMVISASERGVPMEAAVDRDNAVPIRTLLS